MSKRRFWTNDISVMDGTIQRQWVKRHCSKHFSQVWVFLIHPYLAEIPADWRHSLSHPLNPMPQFAFLQPKLFPITFWNNKFLLLQEAKTPRLKSAVLGCKYSIPQCTADSQTETDLAGKSHLQAVEYSHALGDTVISWPGQCPVGTR